MSRFQKNSAFFQQKKDDGNFVVGAGAEDVVAVPQGRGGAGGADVMAGGGGGTITERGLTAAFKRAKQSGVFIVQNQNLAKYPMELCDFVNFTVEGENWWDGSELVRIDMSLNKLESIPEEVHQQNTVQHFNLTGNLIKAIPDTLFKMEALKILDISNNQISVLSDALGEAKALRELQAKGNQIARIPDSIVELQALELLDVSQNKLTALPSTIGSLPRLFKLNLDENQLTVIPACFAGLQALTDLSMAKNKIAAVEEDALAPLSNLCMLELHQNCFSGYFSSVPKSEKLDRLSLAFNQLQGLENVDRAPNLTLLDLHSNKIQTLPDSLCTMYKLQALKISNNDLSDINPRISLLDSLVRMNIEGNPLRSIKPSMRNTATGELKKYLKSRLGDDTIAVEEQRQAVALHIPGATTQHQQDEWDIYLREFCVNGIQLDLRNKELKFISPKLWEMQPRIQTLDLSQNPLIGQSGVPEELANLAHLKSLRLSECALTVLPKSLLKAWPALESLDLSKNGFTTFFDNDGLRREDVDWPCLSYFNMNGNSLTQIPYILRFLPRLRQIHLHMNKVVSVAELCRAAYENIDTLDLGQNKVQEVPTALLFYLPNLSQLTLLNNDIQKLPNLLGKHKKLKNIQVDGNPLKTIRRPIIARGSAGILQYLADKYVEGTDDQIEPWAAMQNEKDKAEHAEYEQRAIELQKKAQAEAEERERAEQERLRVLEEEAAALRAQQEAEAQAEAEQAALLQQQQLEQEKQQQAAAMQQQPVVEAQPQAVAQPASKFEEQKQSEQPVQSSAPYRRPNPSDSSFSFGGGAPTDYGRPARAAPQQPPAAAPMRQQQQAYSHPSQSSFSFGGGPAPQRMQARNQMQPPAATQQPAQVAPAQQQVAQPAAPQQAATGGADVQAQIADINSQIKALQNEIDNNFNLSSMKIREKKREINQLQSKKNALEQGL